MRALSRIMMAALALALVASLLGATAACNECEDFCQQEYDSCGAASRQATEDPQRCQAELSQCLQRCDSEPTGWENLDL